MKTAFACILMLLCLVFPAGQARAATGISVDVHSQSEIKAMMKKLNPRKLATSYTNPPVNTAPYSLGQVSSATLQNGLNTLNMVRYIAGIPYNVQIKTDYQELAQAAALINYVQGYLSHDPAQLPGMSDAMYEKASQGARSSNIGWGYKTLYDEIVFGWMSDKQSNNIDRVGHRRWCLNPTMQYTGFGIDNDYYAMYAFDGSGQPTAYKGVAWPAQNMPLEFFDQAMPWSISMGTPVANASVTLKRLNDGRTWSFSKSSSNGDFYIENSNYGQKGCIIFRPAGIGNYNSGDLFQVTITGTNLSVQYQVNFFSLSDTTTTPATCQHTGGTATCQHKAVCVLCGKEYGPLGSHQYSASATIEKNATCTAAGTKAYSCTVCGAKKQESIPATGHQYENPKLEKNATCTAAGTKAYSCTVCGAKKRESIPATGHQYENPELIWRGITSCNAVFTCSSCGSTQTVKCTVTQKTTATCTKAGSTIYTASATLGNLSIKESVEIVQSKAKGHKYTYTIASNTKHKAVCKTCKKTVTAKHTYKNNTCKYCHAVKLKTPVLTSAKNISGKKISVIWKKTASVTGYQIAYKTGSVTKTVKVKASVRQKALTGLTKGKTYQISVRGYKTIGKTTYYSSWSSAKRVKITK
ncbi:fibronectin type III domain protein [Marvinbryantia formatexigens DSM 14469]|uniref:Fibronectin type III domain protein n=2 Tax=Marvinbryantia TaxID=248744 RepID=C6LE49_9FIRM|nr:fibronectin type III domain protein [Marvinbryantia formatexigens DSM 14469]